MDVLVRITNLSIQSEGKPADDDAIQKMIAERIMDAFNEKPLKDRSWISRYTVELVRVNLSDEQEIDVIARCVEAFKRVDQSARTRIIHYLTSRFGG
jgi:hypothetical protein